MAKTQITLARCYAVNTDTGYISVEAGFVGGIDPETKQPGDKRATIAVEIPATIDDAGILAAFAEKYPDDMVAWDKTAVEKKTEAEEATEIDDE